MRRGIVNEKLSHPVVRLPAAMFTMLAGLWMMYVPLGEALDWSRWPVADSVAPWVGRLCLLGFIAGAGVVALGITVAVSPRFARRGLQISAWTICIMTVLFAAVLLWGFLAQAPNDRVWRHFWPPVAARSLGLAQPFLVWLLLVYCRRRPA
jgi:hypothetical protein